MVSRLKQELKSLVAIDRCICNISLEFAAAFQSGDFIVTELDDPGKFSLFYLCIYKVLNRNDKLNLRMQLMASEGKGIDNDTFNLIIEEIVEELGSMYLLKYLIKTKVYILSQI